MSAQIIPIHTTRAGKAAGVFTQINVIARRMGYSDHLALRAAQRARAAYEAGGRSPGWVVSQVKAELQRHAEPVSA